MVDIPNKSVRSEALLYIEKMNQAQIKNYLKTDKLLSNISYFDLEFGYIKTGGKPDGNLVKIDPSNAVKNGYIVLNELGFASKYYQYLSYRQDHQIAVNIAIPRTIYHFGDKHPFFWRKMQPLKTYIGFVNFENHIVTENFICIFTKSQKNINPIIQNKIDNLNIIKENIISTNDCLNYLE